MRGGSHNILLLFLLLLLGNACFSLPGKEEDSLDLHERDDEDGGAVNTNDKSSVQNQQTSIKHDKEDGLDSHDPQKDGQPIRLLMSAILLLNVAKYSIS